MTIVQLRKALAAAHALDDTERAWISHESQALTPECAFKLTGLGIVEHEMASRTGMLVYTVRTELGAVVNDVCEAQRIAMSWPVEHRQLLGAAQLELTDTTRPFTMTPLFEMKKVRGRNMVCRTKLGAIVHAWLVGLTSERSVEAS